MAPHSSLEDLLTLDFRHPQEIYDRILEELERRIGDGLSLFFRLTEANDGLYYDEIVLRRASEDERRRIDALTNRPFLKSPIWEVRQPPAEHISSFARFRVDEQFEDSDVYKQFLAPLAIHSVVRINVYSGSRFLGQIGSYHRADESPCTSKTLDLVRSFTDPFCAAVAAADRLRNELHSDQGAFAVLTPAGEIEFLSSHATRLLSPGRRDGLRQAVRKLDAGDLAQCVQYLAGLEVRLTRMEGAGLFRYLANFAAPTVPTIEPLSVLTPAQREVAEYAAAGATVEEIARVLQRSPHTVKTHLKNIYQRLGIGCRVELAAYFSPDYNDAG